VLALASVEVDISSIAMGSTVTIKWRGKPVFIRRRTEVIKPTPFAREKHKIELLTLPRFLVTKGDSEFEGYDPTRKASCAPTFPRLPSQNAIQAVVFFPLFILQMNST
jgi:Rieske Fe-S protein